MQEVDLVKALEVKMSTLWKIVVSFARKKVTGQISVEWSSKLSGGLQKAEVVTAKIGVMPVDCVLIELLQKDEIVQVPEQ